jgi:hypothetical protein
VTVITLAYYWKEELDRIAADLEKRQYQRRWTGRSEAAFEKQVFFGAFAARKLIESKKVSPHVGSNTVVLIRYPARKEERIKGPIRHFGPKFERHLGARCELAVWELMSQFIHSYYFLRSYPPESEIAGVFFASDWGWKECLYFITIAELVATFRRVGGEVAKQSLRDLQMST